MQAGPAPCVAIVGGRRARPQEFPFLASLQEQGWHFCGGALVHPRFGMTAASCFRSRNPGVATVVLGAYDLRRQELSRQQFSIRSVSENGYDPQESLNDLLLLQLDREANLNSSLEELPLPPPECHSAGQYKLLSGGLGDPAARGRLSCFPWVVNLTVTPKDQCQPNSVCTSVTGHRGGVCQCDRGTPLICNGLVLSVASSRGFCRRGPDFYTRVVLFRDWINSVLNSPSGGERSEGPPIEPVGDPPIEPLGGTVTSQGASLHPYTPRPASSPPAASSVPGSCLFHLGLGPSGALLTPRKTSPGLPENMHW